MAHHHHDHDSHVHGPDCGHTAIKHGDHTDYLHDGHMHHSHEGHYDDHAIEVSDANPEGCTPAHEMKTSFVNALTVLTALLGLWITGCDSSSVTPHENTFHEEQQALSDERSGDLSRLKSAAGSEGMAPTDALSTHPAFIENQAIIEELVAAHDPSGLSDSEYAVFEASKDWEGLAQELGFEVDHIVELEQTYRDKHQDLTLLHRIIRLGVGTG